MTSMQLDAMMISFAALSHPPNEQGVTKKADASFAGKPAMPLNPVKLAQLNSVEEMEMEEIDEEAAQKTASGN